MFLPPLERIATRDFPAQGPFTKMFKYFFPFHAQVTVSNDKFMIQLELPGFSPEDFALKTRDDVIILVYQEQRTLNMEI